MSEPKRRRTRQLTAVYDSLAAVRDHPTVEQLFQRVREQLPRMSLGTVYRNLDKLRDQGRVRMIRLADGGARYDATLHEHDHFACERCGLVMDLEGLPHVAPATGTLPEGFRIHSQATVFSGLCAACAQGKDEDAAARGGPEVPPVATGDE